MTDAISTQSGEPLSTVAQRSTTFSTVLVSSDAVVNLDGSIEESEIINIYSKHFMYVHFQNNTGNERQITLYSGADLPIYSKSLVLTMAEGGVVEICIYFSNVYNEYYITTTEYTLQ